MTRAMKESGIEWIGKIPNEWDVAPISINFTEVKTRNIDFQVKSALQFKMGTIIRKLKTWSDEDIGEIYSNYLVVSPETIMINGLNLEFDFLTQRVAIVKERGIITSAYIAMFPNPTVYSEYACYLFKAYDFCMAFHSLGRGLRKTLGFSELKKHPMLLPSLNIQQRISDHLDSKCSLIDNTVEKEKLVIEKLKMYKQSVITEAVTKGLDPNCKMKPSGIEWIGEIPERWEVGQLKFFGTISSGITLGKKYPPGTELVEYPYLRVANVQGGYTDLTDIATILITEKEAERYKLQVGEVLMTEGGDRDKLGRGCIWYGEIENCLHQNHIFAVRTDGSKLNARFYDYITTSDVGRNYFDFTAKKTTNLASTNSTTILEFRFPVPHIDKQKEIISYLDTKCSQIDTIITGKQKLLEKLTTYKKSLIYECVTGKREVV